MISRKGIGFLAIAAALLLLASCATGAQASGTGYGMVQVVDMLDSSGFRSSGDDVPLTALIQPESLVTSPVIDIASLKFVEGSTSDVTSSAAAQEKRKAGIAARIEAGEKDVDASLDESSYPAQAPGQAAAPAATSGELARQATESSFQYISSASAFSESIASYDFIAGRIYELITSPKAITDLRLQAGESIAGTPIANDSANWQFSMGTSVEGGETVQHLFIRPLKVGLDTSVIILTDRRTYYFRMASFEESYMTALEFRYPQRTASGAFLPEDFDKYVQAAASASSAYQLDISKADYGYSVRSLRGRPAWKPVTVFSDGVKTYIQFPVSMAASDALPSLYLVTGTKESLVNYRIVAGNIYQADCVLEGSQGFLLKSGQSEQVRITRSR